MSSRLIAKRKSISTATIVKGGQSTARAILYGVAAELIDGPPSRFRLQNVLARLEVVPKQPRVLQSALNLLYQALERTLHDAKAFEKTYAEYKRLLAASNPNGDSYLHPFGSVHGDPKTVAGLRQDCCPREAHKPCPFADYYCVKRYSSPCDHLGAGLKNAGRIWEDVACAKTIRGKRRALARRRRFSLQHLETWVKRINDVLFDRALVEVYTALSLLIHLLIDSESRPISVEMNTGDVIMKVETSPNAHELFETRRVGLWP